MTRIKLLEQEEIISESQNGNCVLTNFRIQYSDRQWGKAYFISILLQNISSIEISYRSNIFVLFIGILSIVVGAVSIEGFLIGLVVGLLFIGLYLLGRRHFIVIVPNGGAKMKLLVKGMRTSEVLTFQNQIEQAIIKQTSSWDFAFKEESE